MKEFKFNDYKNPGFKVPDAYFEEFPEKLMVALKDSEIKVISIEARKNWIFAVAAVLILALTIPFLNQLTVLPNEPDASSIENYIASHDIPNEDIVDFLETEDIQNIKVEYNFEDSIVEDILTSSSDFQQYITN